MKVKVIQTGIQMKSSVVYHNTNIDKISLYISERKQAFFLFFHEIT